LKIYWPNLFSEFALKPKREKMNETSP